MIYPSSSSKIPTVQVSCGHKLAINFQSKTLLSLQAQGLGDCAKSRLPLLFCRYYLHSSQGAPCGRAHTCLPLPAASTEPLSTTKSAMQLQRLLYASALLSSRSPWTCQSPWCLPVALVPRGKSPAALKPPPPRSSFCPAPSSLALSLPSV